MSDPATFEHASAELSGVRSGVLRDAPTLTGLLIAAAGAAGLQAAGAPIVRHHPSGGISAVLMLDCCHATVHSFPEHGLVLVDIIAGSGTATALDVFVRRLVPTAVVSETRMRG